MSRALRDRSHRCRGRVRAVATSGCGCSCGRSLRTAPTQYRGRSGQSYSASSRPTSRVALPSSATVAGASSCVPRAREARRSEEVQGPTARTVPRSPTALWPRCCRRRARASVGRSDTCRPLASTSTACAHVGARSQGPCTLYPMPCTLCSLPCTLCLHLVAGVPLRRHVPCRSSKPMGDHALSFSPVSFFCLSYLWPPFARLRCLRCGSKALHYDLFGWIPYFLLSYVLLSCVLLSCVLLPSLSRRVSHQWARSFRFPGGSGATGAAARSMEIVRAETGRRARLVRRASPRDPRPARAPIGTDAPNALRPLARPPLLRRAMLTRHGARARGPSL